MKKLISIMVAVVLICSTFSVTAFAEKTAGDTNGDGKVTAVDARMLLQIVAGLKPADKDIVYDINGDGKVSSIDARIALQIAAGLYPDTKPDTELDTDEKKLAYFVEAFNGVKKNAKSVTLVGNKLYNYDNYIYVNPILEAVDPTMKESLLEDFSNELNLINETYEGEDISMVFPPVDVVCSLQMKDITKITFEDNGDYYTIQVTVKGKKNPAKNESVGNVASIVTKEDFEAEMEASDLGGVTANCDYKDAVATAKIEKSTGNMVEYSVDYPMIFDMKVANVGTLTAMGMGFYEEWTVAY